MIAADNEFQSDSDEASSNELAELIFGSERPVFSRCRSSESTKQLAKMTFVLKAQIKRNLLDGAISLPELLLRLEDDDSVVKRLGAEVADRILEELYETSAAGAELGTKLRKIE